MELKRKLILFITALICFVALFYHSEPGSNVFIFCITAWLLLGISQDGYKDCVADPGFWALSLAVAVTAGAFSFYGDGCSLVCTLLSFCVLGVYVTDHKFHIILYPLLLAYSFGSFVIRIFFIEKWIPLARQRPGPLAGGQHAQSTGTPNLLAPAADLNKSSSSPQVSSWMQLWVIPVAIALIFVIVYMASSSMFMEVLTRFIPNLDFVAIFGLTLLGFFLLFNFMYLLPIPWLYTINAKVKNWARGQSVNDPSTDPQKQAARQKGALLALSLLIGLLVIFLCVYGYELYYGVRQERLSAVVHEQINSIILSIIMAVAVILYYIRPGKEMSAAGKPAAKPGLLAKLAMIWILLNGLLVISAALHNAAYIQRYGLTLLRIGVYIFLLLSMIGLYFTYKKIRGQHSAGYLIEVMFKVFFATIILNSTVNWSAIVTRYNLTYMEHPDLSYLTSLDYNGHILHQALKNDPRLKDFKYRENDLKRIESDLDYESSRPVLSVAWYYKYAAGQIQREK